MKKSKGMLGLVAIIATAMSANAGLVSINLTNADGPRQILVGETTGVIDADGWVNMGATTANVGGTVVDATLGGTMGVANTSRDKGSGDGTDGFLALYEAGLRDATIATLGDTFITVSDMTAYLAAEGDTSYNIIAYYKSAITASPDTISLGLTTGSLTNVDPDGHTISVNDSFVESANPESNYIVFSGLTSDSTTVYLNKASGGRDGMLTGIQIQTIPEPATLGMVALFGAGLLVVRRKLSM